MKPIDDMTPAEYEDFLERARLTYKLLAKGQDVNITILFRDNKETENGHLYNMASNMPDMESTITFLRNVLIDLESKNKGQ